MSTFIALLRGINVGGHNKVPMADLRALCEGDLGWRDVESYIQSGNLVFRARPHRSVWKPTSSTPSRLASVHPFT